MRRFGKVTLWVVALFYLYGAAVHVRNMLGLSGFNWLDAPMKWQVLDVAYLAIDVVVAVGFIAGWRVAYPAFFTAALSQIVLYSLLRNWIIDVPARFALSPAQVDYLDTLVVFHLVTIIAVAFAYRSTRDRAGTP